MVIKRWQRMASTARMRSGPRCDDWKVSQVDQLSPRALLDVRCAAGAFLRNCQDDRPKAFCLTVGALSAVHAREALEGVGLVETEARSMGLMALPDWLGRHLEWLMDKRGRPLLIPTRKSSAPHWN
jgi:hypothetical protein